MKRRTPEEDPTRLAENLWLNYGNEIIDKRSYQMAMTKYLGTIQPTQKKLIEKTFTELRNKHKNVYEGDIYKEAGGTDAGFPGDKAKTAKTIVKTRQQFKKMRARKVDLANYDMPGKVGKKVVYAAKTVYTYKGKQRIVYRDRKGRFASIRIEGRQIR